MRRRKFLVSLTLGGVGASLARVQASAPTAPLVRTPLVLMSPQADGVEGIWAVNRLSRGYLEWESSTGEKGIAGADPFGFVPQGDSVLRARVSGWEAGKTYRIRSHTTAADDQERVTSEWKDVRTLNPAGAQTRFVMWNDTHVHDPTIRALHEVTPGADFLVWNGDTCNDWKSEDLLVPTLLHPGGCDVTAGRPMFIVWGNHDVRGPHAFRMPGLVATPAGRPFYAFRSGPIACICLHTGEDKPDDHPSFGGRVAFEVLRREQARWLAEVIRRPEMRTAPYRVVFCHIPLRWREERVPDYGNGGYDWHSGRSRDAWHDSLVAWKTQVILSGHTHHPLWIPPNGDFSYGQLTGGGPKAEQATWLEGVADAKEMRLTLRQLTGAALYEVALRPVA